MSAPVKKAHDVVTLLASAAQTETSAGEAAVTLHPWANAFVFTLDVTAAATAAGDTLDVFVQTKADGTNWVDVVHFTQVVGTDTTKRYLSKVTADLATAEFEVGTALGAAAVRNIIGDEWRVRFDITDVTTDDASFTFSVTACPM